MNEVPVGIKMDRKAAVPCWGLYFPWLASVEPLLDDGPFSLVKSLGISQSFAQYLYVREAIADAARIRCSSSARFIGGAPSPDDLHSLRRGQNACEG
jgi:hypothetical protein